VVDADSLNASAYLETIIGTLGAERALDPSDGALSSAVEA
jgi:hypothetical protein